MNSPIANDRDEHWRILFRTLSAETNTERRADLDTICRLPTNDATLMQSALELYDAGRQITFFALRFSEAADTLSRMAERLRNEGGHFSRRAEDIAVDSGIAETILGIVERLEQQRNQFPPPLSPIDEEVRSVSPPLPDYQTPPRSPTPEGTPPPVYTLAPEGTRDNPINLVEYPDDYVLIGDRAWSYCHFCDTVRPEHPIDECQFSLISEQ